MNKNQQNRVHLETEDTVVVNVDADNLLIVTFLEPIADNVQNALQARAGVNKCYDLIEEHRIIDAINIIVDIRPLGSKAYIAPQAKAVYSEFVSDPRIRKVAVLGSSDSLSLISNFILSFEMLNLREKLKWFSDESEARYWVNS